MSHCLLCLVFTPLHRGYTAAAVAAPWRGGVIPLGVEQEPGENRKGQRDREKETKREITRATKTMVERERKRETRRTNKDGNETGLRKREKDGRHEENRGEVAFIKLALSQHRTIIAE